MTLARRLLKISHFALAAPLLLGCSGEPAGNPTKSTPPDPQVKLQAFSKTPALVKALPGFENLEIFPLLSSDDQLDQSTGFLFGAQPDGNALLRNPGGDGFVLLTNHEILRSVSRVYLDKTFRPVKGEYVLDADGGLWRMCSATLATPEVHGFGPVYLTAGEGDADGMIHALDPFAPADKKNRNRVLPALGKASFENAVPLPKGSFPGKTVVVLSEDEGSGQLMVYVSESVGDLQNGKLYFLRRTNRNPVETDMKAGQSYEVEFVEFTDTRTATGNQLAAQTKEKFALEFARVEDVDFRKGSDAAGREIFFCVSGTHASDRVEWGRVYRLALDSDNPLKGKLTILADGSVDPGRNLVNPDNLCVTENYVYIQEDGDAPPAPPAHDGRIWQYALSTNQLKPILEMNHRRDDPDFQRKYNATGHPGRSTWEYGAMTDISTVIGVPNTFLINIHPHTWRDMKFSNADGSSLTKTGSINDPNNGNYSEGGQVVVVRGIPK
ncbi:hypothetical protein [Larkinella soli]|uniref:hypothetical protein n=1 Tax=Larkinella soli TaxID=1770527 RepID=UPI000FFB66BE|nr:hypothetical protein [Larkinella soli]